MPVTEGWNPSLATGYKSIDDQHRALFGAIDALLDALRHGYADQEVKRTLQSMETYAADHFLQEEALMKENGYPELNEHLAAHAAFSTRLGELRMALQQSGTSKALAVQTLQTIGTLLTHDIETHDRKLAGFLKSQSKAT